MTESKTHIQAALDSAKKRLEALKRNPHNHKITQQLYEAELEWEIVSLKRELNPLTDPNTYPADYF